MSAEQDLDAIEQRLHEALERGQQEILRRLAQIEHRLTHDEGVVVRLDRLEQQASWARKSIAAMFVALIGFIVDWIRSK